MFAVYQDMLDGTWLMVAGPTPNRDRAEELREQMQALYPYLIYEEREVS